MLFHTYWFTGAPCRDTTDTTSNTGRLRWHRDAATTAVSPPLPTSVWRPYRRRLLTSTLVSPCTMMWNPSRTRRLILATYPLATWRTLSVPHCRYISSNSVHWHFMVMACYSYGRVQQSECRISHFDDVI